MAHHGKGGALAHARQRRRRGHCVVEPHGPLCQMHLDCRSPARTGGSRCRSFRWVKIVLAPRQQPSSHVLKEFSERWQPVSRAGFGGLSVRRGVHREAWATDLDLPPFAVTAEQAAEQAAEVSSKAARSAACTVTHQMPRLISRRLTAGLRPARHPHVRCSPVSSSNPDYCVARLALTYWRNSVSADNLWAEQASEASAWGVGFSVRRGQQGQCIYIVIVSVTPKDPDFALADGGLATSGDAGTLQFQGLATGCKNHISLLSKKNKNKCIWCKYAKMHNKNPKRKVIPNFFLILNGNFTN